MDLTVLIVDDEQGICKTLKNYLTLSGYSCLTASTGEEALNVIREQKVHIVLLDIKMPGMTGLEALEEIRKFDFSIQVIMMTGFSTFDYTLQALEKGAMDYIQKPFDDLDNVVELVKMAGDRLHRWRHVLAGSSKRRAP